MLLLLLLLLLLLVRRVVIVVVAVVLMLFTLWCVLSIRRPDIHGRGFRDVAMVVLL